MRKKINKYHSKAMIKKQRYFRLLKNQHCKILRELEFYKNEENGE